MVSFANQLACPVFYCHDEFSVEIVWIQLQIFVCGNSVLLHLFYFLNFFHFADPTRIFEHHGDYQCTGVPDGPDSSTSGGLDCLTESVPDGYGKLITHPLGLEGDINDARAPNSTVLEWYYQLAARWVPKLECSEYPQPEDDDQTENTQPERAATSATVTTAAAAKPPAAVTAATTSATAKGSSANTNSAGVSAAPKAPAAPQHQPQPLVAQRGLKSGSKVPSAVYPRPKAMSFHNYAGPGDLNTKQSSFVFTYQVTYAAEPSMFVCTFLQLLYDERVDLNFQCFNR